MKILFAGNPEPAVRTLAALQSKHSIVAVVTSEEKPKGRGHHVSKSPVANFATTQGIDLIETSNINLDSRVAELDFDLAVVVAFGQLIGKQLLGSSRWMNVHYSLLPRWRGASPVQHALLYGDDVTGVTTFFLESQLDSGPIIAQATYMPKARETGTTLMNELSEIGANLALRSLEIIEQGVVDSTIQAGEVTYAPKITRDECRILWEQSAIAIERKVRALYEKPTAFTTFHGKRIQLAPLDLVEHDIQGDAGRIVEVNGDVYVCTGSVPVRLGRVKPEGKTWMEAPAWWRGIHNQENAVFQ